MTNLPDRIRLLASAFTRPVFAAMARTGDHDVPLRALVKAGVLKTHRDDRQPLSSVFDEAWDHIARTYRNEYVYKNDLASRLVFGRHSPRTASFQVELPVGRSIVDVAVANGTTTAYEIKTEYDTAKRLKTQTYDYLQAFDRVFVVTHPAHLKRFESEVDSRVGLISLSTKGTLSIRREAHSNLERLDSATIFRCLRQSEYLDAIEMLFGERPSLPNGLIGAYCEKLFSTVSSEDAHRIFVNALRARTTDSNTVGFVSQLPTSLRALGYATPLSGRQRSNILALLSKPVGLTVVV
ncbi:sce7726 family protein [Burkholderia cenocepacia]|uniref:Sce7726 family protein n=1 Tax=Burkholderia orbicola (strain AU 1054) TaxID=331271 RepID=A0A0H2XRT4_BURO1|nr:sce7726 family protein [Burkholderia cenocepacia]ABK07209.1 conserved hypothetical protein [Burkholderia cenocepacia HI2424]MBJ9876047.1 sce7726 family protein [Burkholderia cenocepacia]MCA8419115.1 sce7726 family protein [Burkholderia cenocepacia]PNO65253.1 hypothetical protein DK10_033875 [Burkholderia cenocepacia]QIY41763.1 sce7726 family protein [Burkholderia cenocepacia]